MRVYGSTFRRAREIQRYNISRLSRKSRAIYPSHTALEAWGTTSDQSPFEPSGSLLREVDNGGDLTKDAQGLILEDLEEFGHPLLLPPRVGSGRRTSGTRLSSWTGRTPGLCRSDNVAR
jgi:hypothetical protein